MGWTSDGGLGRIWGRTRGYSLLDRRSDYILTDTNPSTHLSIRPTPLKSLVIVNSHRRIPDISILHTQDIVEQSALTLLRRRILASFALATSGYAKSDGGGLVVGGVWRRRIHVYSKSADRGHRGHRRDMLPHIVFPCNLLPLAALPLPRAPSWSGVGRVDVLDLKFGCIGSKYIIEERRCVGRRRNMVGGRSNG